MYVEINITGGIQGNYILLNKLSGYEYKIDKDFNAGFRLGYSMKSKAMQALKQAFKELKEEEPEYTRLYMKGNHLFYDASKAFIE